MRPQNLDAGEGVVGVHAYEHELEPIFVLPEQPDLAWETREHYLWAAVLETGILDARKGMKDAVEWVESTEHRDIQDFECVCEVLGFDPGAVRRAVLGGYNGPQANGSDPQVES